MFRRSDWILTLQCIIHFATYLKCASIHDSRIIIVGGGASGIAAATRLLQNGFKNVTILEAEHRLGGRCNTITLGTDQIDLGAQWIHGQKGNVVYEMAAPLNLTKDTINRSQDLDKPQSMFFLPNKKRMNPVTSRALFKYCLGILDSLEEQKMVVNKSISVGEVFMERFNHSLKSLKDQNISELEIQQFLEWFHKAYINIMDALDSWYDLSYEGHLKYEVCEGNDMAWKTGGYSNVIDLLLRKIPVQLNVLFDKEVTEIHRNHEIGVKCADGSVYKADHVIVTVSLGVLKQNKAMFTPALPANKLSAINTLELGTVEKIFLQFPYKWWPVENGVFFNILLDSNIKNVLKNSRKEWLMDVPNFLPLDNAPNTLGAWVVGKGARHISTLPDHFVKYELYWFMKRYLSDNFTIPAPIGFAKSNWFENPHFRGSYSYITVKANEANVTSEDLAEPIRDEFGKPVLMFAGEATHSHFYGTVHGAVETGWREADRLISYYKKADT